MGASDLGGRLPLRAPADLEPDARRLYNRLVEGRLGAASPFINKTDTGKLIGPFNAVLYAPAIGEGFVGFHEAEEHATPLPQRVREIVILSIGAVWGAPYETYAHRAKAAQAGFPSATVAALAAGEMCEGLSEAEQAAQRFTLALARDRVVGMAAYEAAEQAFGREGLVALVFLAAAYTATCVLLNAFEVPAPAL